ncbi:MAG TPA: hypothetical protein VGL23_08365 [Chloroflexota bacterium]
MARLDRRRLIGAGLVSAGAVGLIANHALAQGTPVAPPAPGSFEVADRLVELGAEGVQVELAGGPFELPFPPPMLAGGPDVLAYRTARVEAVGPISAESLAQQLASAKADRDAAAGKGDVSAASALLQTAEALIGQASPNLKSTDRAALGQAHQQARGALAAIRAARAQLEAIAGSLPSMQTPTSHQLTMAHRVVSDATQAAKTASPEASSLVQSAQALYRQAYEAYQAAEYARAADLAGAASEAATAARALAPPPAPPKAPPAPNF